jgi:hypothetical protein
LIQILHEVTPSARRFAILLNESNPRIRHSGPPPRALACR